MEEWKQISKAPKYEISTLGRVRNLSNKKIRKTFNDRGYPRIRLPIGTQLMSFRIHRLVAEAFIDGYNEELEVDHINRVRDDNRAENLRMLNRADNLKNRICSVGVVEHIISLHDKGYSASEIYSRL